MRELALFAGAGGGILGGRLLGWHTVCAVEINAYCRSVLLQRQRDGHLPRFPIWDDVSTFDGHEWRGHVDIITGGFPCQDISSAGKRAGIDGERSGLWREYARILDEVRPPFAFIENSQHLRTKGLVRVLKDLAGMGYNARWGVFGASDVGAPHERKRMWIAAYANDRWKRAFPEHDEVALPSEASGVLRDTNSSTLWVQPRRGERADWEEAPISGKCNWWDVPCIPRMAHGLANRVERFRAVGNGQVPAVAALAWRTLMPSWEE